MSTWTQQTEGLLSPLDLFHMSVSERGCKEGLEQEENTI